MAEISMNPESSVRHAARIAARVVEGNAVVVVIDDRALHTLNRVGTFIWTSMEPDGCRIGDIVDAVRARFEVEPDRAEADVHGFLRELLALGALELQAPE